MSESIKERRKNGLYLVYFGMTILYSSDALSDFLEGPISFWNTVAGGLGALCILLNKQIIADQ